MLELRGYAATIECADPVGLLPGQFVNFRTYPTVMFEAVDAAREAADEAAAAARRATDSFRLIDAKHAREVAHIAAKAARERQDFDIAYGAYNVALAVGLIARGRAAAASDPDTDTAASTGVRVSAVLFGRWPAAFGERKASANDS